MAVDSLLLPLSGLQEMSEDFCNAAAPAKAGVWKTAGARDSGFLRKDAMVRREEWSSLKLLQTRFDCGELDSLKRFQSD